MLKNSYILSYILLFFVQGTIAASFDVKWKPLPVNPEVKKAFHKQKGKDAIMKIWHLRSNKQIQLTLQGGKEKRRITWKNLQSSAYLKEIEKAQRTLMGMMNIIDRTVDNYDKYKRKNHYELIIDGHYFRRLLKKDKSGKRQDMKRQKVYFREVHFYYPDRAYYIMLKGTNKESLNKEFLVAQILKRKYMTLKRRDSK